MAEQLAQLNKDNDIDTLLDDYKVGTKVALGGYTSTSYEAPHFGFCIIRCNATTTGRITVQDPTNQLNLDFWVGGSMQTSASIPVTKGTKIWVGGSFNLAYYYPLIKK